MDEHRAEAIAYIAVFTFLTIAVLAWSRCAGRSICLDHCKDNVECIAACIGDE